MARIPVAASLLILIVVIALLGGVMLSGAKPSHLPDRITVAYSPYESTALFWIAEDQQYFGRYGLCVTTRSYASGAASLEGVLNGEADIAVGVSEFPLVRKGLDRVPVRTIGSIDKGDFIYLVARRDRGISNIPDLAGKRIGTTRGTVAEFHLGRFLMLHGLGAGDVTIVNLATPDEWEDAVPDGYVDAIATAQPYANAVRERLGENAVTWPVQSSQPVYGLVVAREDWLSSHPGTAAGLLRSLADAEAYTYSHPADARKILQEALQLNPGYLDTVWQQNQFSLGLDQSLILAMEDEARWMIRNNLTNATMIPDFYASLDTTVLDGVKPGSVNIIHRMDRTAP